MEVASVLEVSGTEEGGTESSVSEHPFCDSLCDRALSCPSKPIQPIDRGLPKVADPEFDPVQNCSARTLETTITISVSVLGLLCISESVEDSRFRYQRGIFQAAVAGNVKVEGNLTWVLPREVIFLAQT